MSTMAMSGRYERTFISSSSAVPHWPTISKPLSSSSAAMPSRSRTESSAMTTRVRPVQRWSASLGIGVRGCFAALQREAGGDAGPAARPAADLEPTADGLDAVAQSL